MNPVFIFLIYLAAVSLLSVIITCADKFKASHGRWRVRESTLLIFSTLGGSLAMFVTMQLIHHKTRKLKFMLGIPLIMIAQAAFLWWLFIYVL